MYHGQVMVEQERIPQLLQTAQLLEVRGLCEIREGETGIVTEDKAKGVRARGNHSFLAGLLGTSVSATKRTLSLSDSNSCSNTSPTPPVTKRQKNTSRPVPMLQSILSHQLPAPVIPTFDLSKSMGTSTRALTALASKVQANSSNMVSTSCSSVIPSTLENLLGGLNSSMTKGPSTGGNANDNSISQYSTSSCEDMSDNKEEKVESCYGEMDSSEQGGGPELEPHTIVEIKEEPIIDFEDEFCDDNIQGAGSAEEEGMSESETELGLISENSRGEASLLPLLAQHLASPNLLTASAKLRAAASQARNISGIVSSGDPLMGQVLLGQPSTPPDMGPSSMSVIPDTASPSK